MKLYKITVNGVYNETRTGMELYTAILDKFHVKYKLEVIEE
jgi:hypothetical protein